MRSETNPPAGSEKDDSDLTDGSSFTRFETPLNERVRIVTMTIALTKMYFVFISNGLEYKF